MLAALPPIAGSTPMTTPTNDDHASRNGRRRISPSTLRCDTARLTARSSAAPARAAAPIFSTSDMICAKANTPISTGRNGTPPSRNSMPSVSRGWPITGSFPSTVTTRPIAPERKPFSSERPTRPATIDSASTNSEKNSQGPNSSANFASGSVAAIRNTPPIMPPRNEPHTPSQSARPASPFRAIGKPSNVVATDEGVPGMPSSVAVTSPPAEPPTYTPVIAARPCSGSRPKVNGSTMITVMVMVTPGSAPPTTPATVPITSGIRYLNWNRPTSACHSSSYTAQYPVQVPRGSSTARYCSNT